VSDFDKLILEMLKDGGVVYYDCEAKLVEAVKVFVLDVLHDSALQEQLFSE
jgi:hypothetical protein